jgi:DNA repair protein RAD5
VETTTVSVELSPAEREFYNSLMLKSQTVFEGFLKDGTANKSWFAIFSLLNRLRQACDHVALTVKSQMEDDWNPAQLHADADNKKKASPVAAKAKKASNDKDALGDEVSQINLSITMAFFSESLT